MKTLLPASTCLRFCLRLPTALALAALTWLPCARAVTPPPGGGYPNGTTALGDDAAQNLVTTYSYEGKDNTALGYEALYNTTIGGYNTATGYEALFSNTTGELNTATGCEALFSNTTGEFNTSTGYEALYSNTTGEDNTASGSEALSSNTTGSKNTAIGNNALAINTTGSDNTAVGDAALQFTIVGNNSALGWQSLFYNKTGSSNVAVGSQSLFHNTSGSNNVALGSSAGFNQTNGSNNVVISNSGVAGESGTIRLGTAGKQTNAYVAGITGVTVASGVPVVIDSNGHLGTTTSSERFKEAIAPMEDVSAALLALRPVTFRYKPELDPAGIRQCGLIAEQVAKVDPDLVARDAQGTVYTVRYEQVNAMLLNEFLKEHARVQAQATAVGRLEATNAEQARQLASQQVRIEELTSGLKAQATLLQKVSDQMEDAAAVDPLAVYGGQ